MNDPLIIMQSDLERALGKPEGSRRWAMIIDQRKCVGCNACTVACMAENVTGPKLHYKPVYETETGKYPDVKRVWTPSACNQCDNPACVSVCPVNATGKETKGVAAGIITIDYNACIGCGSCVEACPYGARKVDEGKYYTENTPEMQSYETRNFFEYGSVWNRKSGSPMGKARKCHFCINRLAEKMLPVCVSTCIGRAAYFGDINDKDSLVAQIFKTNKVTQAESVQEKNGMKRVVFGKNPATKPNVYYIVQE